MSNDLSDLLQPLLSSTQPLSSSYRPPSLMSSSSPVPVDFNETPTGYIVQADVPGVKKDTLKIRVVENVLEINFEKMETTGDDDAIGWLIKEIRAGKFERKIVLPDKAKTYQLGKAILENGVLTVTLGQTSGYLSNLLKPTYPSSSALEFPVDWGETLTQYIIQAEVPGVKQDELKIWLVRNVLEITYERSPKMGWLCNEQRPMGKFRRKFLLPVTAKIKQLKATSLKYGVLTLTLGK